MRRSAWRRAPAGLAASVACAVGLVAGAVGVRAQTAPGPLPAGPAFGVRAAQTGLTTLERNHFAYAVTAGTTVRDAIIVSNFTGGPLSFHVYGADIITAIGGGLAPVAEGVPSTLAGTWISVSRPGLVVPAHQELTDPFAVSVPPGAQPGDYLGSVVVGQQAASGSGIQVVTREALIARVTVPGKVHLGVSPGPLSGERQGGDERFTLPVRNTGNVLFTFTGEVTVRGAGGRVLAAVPVDPQDIYVIPGGVAVVRAVWHGVPDRGEVTAVGTVHARLNGQPAGDYSSPVLRLSFSPAPATIAGFPLPLVVGAAAWALLVLLALLALVLRHGRRCRCAHCRTRVARRQAVEVTSMADVAECRRCLRVILEAHRARLCRSCLKQHLVQSAATR